MGEHVFLILRQPPNRKIISAIAAYGKVFLARKRRGADCGQLYAMKVLKKATIVQKRKTTEHTKTERCVLQTIRQSPFLVTMHYAFQTTTKLHLVLGEYKSRQDMKLS